MTSRVAPLHARVLKPESYLIEKEPYYESVGDEIALFDAAYASQIPVLLKGPTGCGKTRFMEYMAWRLKRPLITVSCHDDLTAADLVGAIWSRAARPPGWMARWRAQYAPAPFAIWTKSSKRAKTPWS